MEGAVSVWHAVNDQLIRSIRMTMNTDFFSLRTYSLWRDCAKCCNLHDLLPLTIIYQATMIIPMSGMRKERHRIYKDLIPGASVDYTIPTSQVECPG